MSQLQPSTWCECASENEVMGKLMIIILDDLSSNGGGKKCATCSKAGGNKVAPQALTNQPVTTDRGC